VNKSLFDADETRLLWAYELKSSLVRQVPDIREILFAIRHWKDYNQAITGNLRGVGG